MIELVYIQDLPNWQDCFISSIFNSRFWDWLPDEDTSFVGLVEETRDPRWETGEKIGWVVVIDGKRAGMIWGDIEDCSLKVNIYFSTKVSGHDKVQACRVAESIVKALGVDEVVGEVCNENKRSLALCRYLGYKAREPYTKIRNDKETEYREVYKCLCP